jgi:phosphocarrier protein HPr
MLGSSDTPESTMASVTLAGDLHARPAGSLAIAAAKFESSIELSSCGSSADAKSVLSVMGIGATSGQQVTVRATGPDADQAVAALVEILAEATSVGA